DLGHHGGSTRTGAAALAGGDEDHVGALQHLLDLLAVLLGGLATDLGVGAGAEAAGELAPDVELHVGVAHEQRLRVGVDGDELDALQTGVDHAVDGVHATAADADDLDDREGVLRVGDHGWHYLHEGLHGMRERLGTETGPSLKVESRWRTPLPLGWVENATSILPPGSIPGCRAAAGRSRTGRSDRPGRARW